MLNDQRIEKVIDFVDSRDCFPGVDVAGGICYFLWSKNYKGQSYIESHNRHVTSISVRLLNEYDILIRNNTDLNIIKKVRKISSDFLIISARKPFGIGSNIKPTTNGEYDYYWKSGFGKISASKVTAGLEIIHKWKTIVSRSSSEHAGQSASDGTKKVLSKILVLPPNCVCSETYLVAGVFDNESQAIKLCQYLKTKFVRFLISTVAITQDITREKYRFVPTMNINEELNDEYLYKLYDFNDEEIKYIESSIRLME